MDNRFGIKDFFLFALLAVLLAVVVLAMVQYDRQWEKVSAIEAQNRTLAGDLNRVARTLEGLSAGGRGGGGGQIVQNFYGVGTPGQVPTAGAGAATTPGGGGATPQPQQAAVVDLDAGGSPDAGGADGPFRALVAAENMDGFARGGWFLDNFGIKIGRLTPLVSSDVYQSWIEALVLESMAQRDPYTLDFEPKLARSWDISEDGLTVTFRLRDGLRFSDGQPLTAEDVKFTFDWINNPDVQAERQRAYLEKLEGVEVIDSLTVRFTFSEPYFLNFETVAGTGILPKHFYGDMRPIDFNESVGLLMGSGQYMLSSPTDWDPAQDVVLMRNPRYWGVAGTFDRMVFKQIEEETAQQVMFRNGELDRLGLPPEAFEELRDDPAVAEMSRALSYDSPFGGYTYVGWNQEKLEGGVPVATPFADARVRRAMTMMIDRERLAEELYLGYATVATGPFAPGSPQSDPEIEPWPHDVSAARALLAEAGYEDRDGDGVVEDESGRPLQFSLMYAGGNEFTEKIALAIQDDMAEGGVQMEIESLLWPVLIDRLKKSEFEAATLGWSGTPESDPYQIFSSAQAKVGGDNRTAYRSERLDAAIEDARTTVDREPRMEKWHEVHRILHEDQPYTFLLNRQALRLFNDRVKNVEESPLGLNYEYLNGGVLPWFIPAEQQRRTR